MNINNINKLGKNSNAKQQQNRKKKGFYESVRWTLSIVRYCGMLPLKEFRPADSGQLTRNKWICKIWIIYALIYMLSLVVQVAKLVFVALEPLYKKYHVERFIILINYLNLLLVGIFMIPFCKNWAKVLTQVEEIESSLPSVSEKNIKKMRRLMTLVCTLGIVDYVLFNSKLALSAAVCSFNDADNPPIKTYFVKVTTSVFDILPFNYLTAILLEIPRLQLRVVWIFTDCLVINVSVYINIRFEEFNRYLREKEKENLLIQQHLAKTYFSTIRLTYNNKADLPWANIQQKYSKLMKLTQILEQFFSHFVFFSFCNFIMIGRQFYFIINQHFTSAADCGNYGLYLFTLFRDLYTAVHLVTRMGLVSGYAAQIYAISRKPLDVLYSIPAYSYDRTFQRFVDQVYYSNISLSGFRCFYVTRQMILSMMASLLTFELALLDSNNSSSS